MGELVNRGESAIVPEGFYKQVSSILNAARDKAYTAVNFAMVEAYWEIGAYRTKCVSTLGHRRRSMPLFQPFKFRARF